MTERERTCRVLLGAGLAIAGAFSGLMVAE